MERKWQRERKPGEQVVAQLDRSAQGAETGKKKGEGR